jgi:hypothetical protein
MAVQFITFGTGHNFIAAANRLVNQAESLDIFSNIHLYTDEELKADKDFWSQHGSFIENNPRGYGYFIWKPYIIKKTLEQMKDGDKLIYLDAGCEIDIRKKNNILDHLNYLEDECMIASYQCIEREFSKIDLILHLGMLDATHLECQQRQSNALMFLVSAKTRDFVNKWYELCCNYHLLDDSPSFEMSLRGYKEHRHDQSIFSLLSKKYNLFRQWHSIQSCISIARNISGTSQLDS